MRLRRKKQLMDTREQARQQARAALAALPAEAAWDIETGCEAGWDCAEEHPNASVEEVRQEATRQAQVRWLGDEFRQSFISAALGGVEGLLR